MLHQALENDLRRDHDKERASVTKINKVVLAYSGGLDTSIILKWLVETYDCEVVAYAADLGQGDELGGIEARALATGAVKVGLGSS